MPSRNCRTIDGVAWRYNDSGSQCIEALCARIVEGNDQIEVQALRLWWVVCCGYGASSSWSRVWI